MSKMLSKLNEKQRQIVMHIYNCFTTKQLPFNIFLSGSAGVGKSLVINTIYQLVSSYINSQPDRKSLDSVKVLLCAPSGKAAFLINGTTLHSAFSLPVNEFAGRAPELSEDITNTLRVQLKDLELLITDEVSMCGSRTMSNMEARLRKIMGKREPFGGVSVLVVGDLFQLPPVKDRFVFLTPNVGNDLWKLIDNPIWRDFKLFELTEIMRQKEDKAFINTLNHIAHNCVDDEDIELLRTRVCRNEQVPITAIRLFARNEDVDNYNRNRIETVGGSLYISKAIDLCLSTNISQKDKLSILSKYSKKKPNETQGIRSEILIKSGIKYMIIVNLDIPDGLVNGATGILKFITMTNVEGTQQPHILWLEFLNKNVGKCLSSKWTKYMTQNKIESGLVPIEKYDAILRGQSEAFTVVRKQFPVVPAEAITVHKSQGETFENVCVDFTKSSGVQRTSIYVAYSRCTSLKGLFIIGDSRLRKPAVFPKECIVTNKMNRMRNDASLKIFCTEIGEADDVKIVYQNINSLKNKLKFIAVDKWYHQADLIVFAETNSKPEEKLALLNYSICFRSDQHADSRSHSAGIIVYAKDKDSLIIKMNKCVKRTKYVGNKYCYHVELFSLNVNGIDLISGYKSPKTPKMVFEETLEEVMKAISVESKVVLLGDLNLDTFEVDSPIETYLQGKYNFIRGLPERKSTNFNDKQIDTIFTKNLNKYTSGIYETYFSDHKPIYIGINAEAQPTTVESGIKSLKEAAENKALTPKETVQNVEIADPEEDIVIVDDDDSLSGAPTLYEQMMGWIYVELTPTSPI